VVELLLFCPACDEIVEPERGEDGLLHYYCEECESFVNPVNTPPKDLPPQESTD
jgi:hypothetical protein